MHTAGAGRIKQAVSDYDEFLTEALTVEIAST
jgi:hypothetical protein